MVPTLQIDKVMVALPKDSVDILNVDYNGSRKIPLPCLLPKNGLQSMTIAGPTNFLFSSPQAAEEGDV